MVPVLILSVYKNVRAGKNFSNHGIISKQSVEDLSMSGAPVAAMSIKSEIERHIDETISSVESDTDTKELVKSTMSSLGSDMRKTKRASSASNDFLYERDRFRTRLYSLNIDPKDDLEEESCEVCDVIGSKTAKLNVKDPSPLCEESFFFQQLSDITIHNKIDIKALTFKEIEFIFDWYFRQPLPPTQTVFPWLHGLHADNFSQRKYFARQFQKRNNQKRNNELETITDIKPKARFLMTINSDLDNNGLLLRNNTLLNEILRPVDISKDEVKAFVDDVVMEHLPNYHLRDVILEDITAINLLPVFLNLDATSGINLRNFHIQVTKLAICSDFIVYCFNPEHLDNCYRIARLLWVTQRIESGNNNDISYNVFILEDFRPKPLSSGAYSVSCNRKITKNYDINKLTKLNLEYLQTWNTEYTIKERVETLKMSCATKVIDNVFLGNSWDYQNFLNFKHSNLRDQVYKKCLDLTNLYCNPSNSIVTSNYKTTDLIETILPLPNLKYKMLIGCYNEAKFPDDETLQGLLKVFNDDQQLGDYYMLSFPSSGSIGIGDIKTENIICLLNVLKLMYIINNIKQHDILVYCSDGYTELSLLSLCYLIYCTNCLLNDAIIDLHLKYGRPFYIFNTDVQILSKLEGILRKYSPVNKTGEWDVVDYMSPVDINKMLLSGIVNREPDWCKEVDGSLPSKILPYLYLGSLKHANCLPLLGKLGIKKVISVGENLDWLTSSKFERENDVNLDVLSNGDIELYNISSKDSTKVTVDQVMKINNLQDDGIDLSQLALPFVLKFIEDEYQKSNGQTKILVHCRVGVSRSATVVIAEVMKRLKVNLPRAYLYVRVRRLNIIIQPNLKLMYELFKWEEDQNHFRDIDWFAMCREITLLNTPYTT